MKKQLIISLCLLLSISSAKSQVTIGSGIAPNKGALLDLKQEEKTDGSANSSKGLLLPRVELKDPKKLQMGTLNIPDGNNGENQHAKHTGLLVYNLSEDAPFCKGLYVWDSQEWIKLGDECTYLNVVPSGDLMFLSGLNGSTITPQSLTLTWNPATATASFSGDGTTSPLPSAWTSPQTISYAPTSFTDTDIATNVFAVKDKEIMFKISENGKDIEKKITITQVNKAITVNGKVNPDPKSYTANVTNESLEVKSNAKWKLASVVATGTPAVELLAPTSDLNIVKGKELEDGTADTPVNIAYKVTVGVTRARYNYLTFEDAHSPKRFNDVVVTATQCGGTGDLTMEEYKDLWEQMYGLDPLNDEPDSDGDINKNKNKVRWHYGFPDLPAGDDDQHIFFSAVFGQDSQGNDQRWMITNLAATKYASNVLNPPTPLSPNYTNSYTSANYGYPNPQGTTNAGLTTQYDARQRLGLLYNWHAATAGKNTSTGNQQNTTHGPHQGICPDGWHLPTDKEWTDLETTLKDSPTQWSGNSTGNNTAETIIDMCEPTVGNGKSFGVLDGGFSALLAGLADNGSLAYQSRCYFWSSSSAFNVNAWCWYLDQRGGMDLGSTGRYALYSVRCKKD